MKKRINKVIFENIGGSFQFNARNAGDLHKILQLDPTAWAALCVPVNSLNGDREFFNALDNDGNNMVRVDEVKTAISWLFDMLKDINVLNDRTDALPAEALREDNTEAAELVGFIRQHATELLNDKQLLELGRIRSKLAKLQAGPLAGNGILVAAAINGQAANELYTDITTLYNTPGQLSLEQLEKFSADAASFLQWSKTAEKPQFRNDDPVKYYSCFKSIAGKIDEYFRFCELIRIDQAHARRFALDPEKLPELDLQNPAQIDELLKNAPLARPDAEEKLVLSNTNNPFYQHTVETFRELFKLDTLTSEEWAKLKAEFAPYQDYLAKAQGDLAGQLGCERLAQHLANGGIDELKSRFAEDKALGSVIQSLRKLERLLLYCRYMLEFVNNFVSFEAFFDSDQSSMLQAGQLIMDGKSYNLAVWIDDIPSHKKIAVRSGLCLLYLEVASSGKQAIKRKVAVAVTGGAMTRIYVGKPAFFVDNDNITYHGRIVDMVDGPISFGQTIMAPFRRLSDAISNKLQKLTDFSNTEKELNTAIDKGKMPAQQTVMQQNNQVPFSQRFLNNGTMMVLAGGLSLAALGAGFSFVLKAITGAITSISALPIHVILIWIAVFLSIFLVPMAIFAFLRLRKRNLTLFLEAGGWAVNLPMRLNIHVSGIFTRGTQYPAHTVFKVMHKPRRRRSMLFIILVMLVLAVAAAALWYLHRR
ncbi:MAG: hypothetical protein E7047_06565 [Lentisphaerae bacterium]|nr:hypothetical protein [Lentisphaerota bacterium]